MFLLSCVILLKIYLFYAEFQMRYVTFITVTNFYQMIKSMVDTISLIIAIIAVIIGIVAVVLVFVIPGPSSGGTTGPVGPIGPTGPAGGGTGASGGNILAYGTFETTLPITTTVVSGVPKSFDALFRDVGIPRNMAVTTAGVITVNTTVNTLMVITGSNAIFPDRTTITDMNFTAMLRVGTELKLSNTNTYNLSTYNFNTFLSNGYAWNGVVAAGTQVTVQTEILAGAPTGTAALQVNTNPTYINIVCYGI